MKFKKSIKKLLRKFGYEISRYNPKVSPLFQLLNAYNIDLVIDVGANIGQYGERIRDLGYKGKIVSFEPQTEAFAQLCLNAVNDNNWIAINKAIGDMNGKIELNIARNSFSSSFLEMLPTHLKSAPQSDYIAKEEVEIVTLDSIIEQIKPLGENIFLKIDTQGFEKNVLAGATDSLTYIDTIQLEMSLTPLYNGELLFNEMYNLLYDKGYRIVCIEPGFSDAETGQLLQIDGIFRKFS